MARQIRCKVLVLVRQDVASGQDEVLCPARHVWQVHELHAALGQQFVTLAAIALTTCSCAVLPTRLATARLRVDVVPGEMVPGKHHGAIGTGILVAAKQQAIIPLAQR